MKIVPKVDEITKLRILKGYSIDALAKVAGVNKNTITRAEEGRPIYPSTAKKIQTALETEFETIYTLEK